MSGVLYNKIYSRYIYIITCVYAFNKQQYARDGDIFFGGIALKRTFS